MFSFEKKEKERDLRELRERATYEAAERKRET